MSGGLEKRAHGLSSGEWPSQKELVGGWSKKRSGFSASSRIAEGESFVFMPLKFQPPHPIRWILISKKAMNAHFLLTQRSWTLVSHSRAHNSTSVLDLVFQTLPTPVPSKRYFCFFSFQFVQKRDSSVSFLSMLNGEHSLGLVCSSTLARHVHL